MKNQESKTNQIILILSKKIKENKNQNQGSSQTNMVWISPRGSVVDLKGTF